MVYLDYSATTPVNKEVLDSFNKVVIEYPGNANSIHKLGSKSWHLLEAATKQVASLMGVNSDEVIFTSGASEANNLAILGVINKYKNRGKHILTTKLEHSSILETLKYLEKEGYKIEYLKLDENGQVDINDLKSKLNDETVLVSLAQVSSEVGIIQDINKIGQVLKDYPRVIFHVDGTQAVGKIPVKLDNVDLYSFSSHKIYGLNGVGALIKKRHIELEPLIHGGKSQTIYRSGTPTHALCASFAKALKLVLENSRDKYNHVLKLNQKLKESLETMNDVIINSNNYSVPHIVNISIKDIKPETMLHALEEKDIYISTKTACSKDSSMSLGVYELTKDKEIASSSIRISLSYLTTSDEVDYFLEVFKTKLKELRFRKGE